MKEMITIETIGPQQAKEILATNVEGQRNLRTIHVRGLASEMECGKWVLSPDAITIENGQLINGQHRLNAVVLSGKTCRFIVLRREAKTSLYPILDSGKPRTMGDHLKQLGFSSYNGIAAGVRLFLEYSKGTLTLASRNAAPNIVANHEIISHALRFKTELESEAACVQKLFEKRTWFNRTMALALIEIAREKGLLPRAIEFLEQTATGNSGSNITCLLRDRLVRDATSGKEKLLRSYKLALIIKAFNFYVRGEAPRVLKVLDGEEFPKI